MASTCISTSRMLRPSLASSHADAVLSFLVPSIRCARFSTSPTLLKKDNNSSRGVSAVRQTGLRPRQTLSVRHKDFANQQLPTPVKIEEKPTGTHDHGLWDFFKDQKLLSTPEDLSQHGREWTMGELRSKDWDSLHQLWWVCVKERNRLATEKLERARMKALYGDFEGKARDEVVQKTMKAIVDTLAERTQAYQEALALASSDPSIDLSRTDGPQYTQLPYDPLEPEAFEDEEAPAADMAKDSTSQPNEKLSAA
ncbi:54S ribosomal protein L4 mitochondrial [Ascochyta rabiei]|uniref:Large ribosomal subunit protein uL29m n=1 Tax=Didymella rabiei TaxID=5454 RepID=A0A163D810_DIDRA|nr:54S ribosomal protein L4 mitochondrial [Ascochyta rabiei]KZM22979.1 structural constituent of ribosome [Ascochyta rabiei]UPX20986.1 54S ribosomal protein L4 mitochondrial [Ascochyta rabiei]